MTHQSEQQNIQASFDSTLKDSDLQNLGIDMAEVAIDSVLSAGLLKDVPIVGTLVSLSKVGANVHDKLFLKKIMSFLNGLKDISVEDRNKIIREIDESKKYRIKVGEKLLYIIDKCDDYEISELVSLVFKYFIKGNITYNEFLKVATILNNITVADFKWFIKDGRRCHNIGDAGDLISTGLFELNYDDINVDIVEKYDPIPEKFRTSKEKKYETEVDGGVSMNLSRSGKILLEIFSPEYNKSKITKIIL